MRCEGGCTTPYCSDLIYHNGYCLEPKVRMTAMALRQEQQVDVSLTPDLEARLHSAVTQYVGLMEQINMLEEMADYEKAAMLAILEEAGTDKALQDGYHVNVIRGTSSSLDKAKLKALGVTDAMLLSATTIKPKKPYVALRKADGSNSE